MGATRVTDTATQEYDANENIVFVTLANVQLQTRAAIEKHFDAIVSFWKDNCGGQRVYYVVDYGAGFSIHPRETDFYAVQMKRVLQGTITVVRYGGNPLQRTAVRLVNMKLHSPSHLYGSREEALEVVRALKVGEMELEAPP